VPAEVTLRQELIWRERCKEEVLAAAASFCPPCSPLVGPQQAVVGELDSGILTTQKAPWVDFAARFSPHADGAWKVELLRVLQRCRASGAKQSCL
jgi:hypothetical protein